VNGTIFHLGNEVEGVAAVLALAETIPDIFFSIHAELGFVRAFVDGAGTGQAVAAAFESVEQFVMGQHLFHGNPGTDVPEINKRFSNFGHGIFSFEGSLCGSGIELRPVENNTMTT
jgi:hypothetical protein